MAREESDVITTICMNEETLLPQAGSQQHRDVAECLLGCAAVLSCKAELNGKRRRVARGRSVMTVLLSDSQCKPRRAFGTVVRMLHPWVPYTDPDSSFLLLCTLGRQQRLAQATPATRVGE